MLSKVLRMDDLMLTLKFPLEQTSVNSVLGAFIRHLSSATPIGLARKKLAKNQPMNGMRRNNDSSTIQMHVPKKLLSQSK